MIANEDTNKTIPPPSHQQPPRRERMNYGVVSIIDASKARYINTSATIASTTTTITGTSILEPGDIILTINGQSVGGMIFSNAIRLMSLSNCGLDATTSTTTGDDIICCYLTVARQRRRSMPTVKSLPPSSRAAIVVGGGVPTNSNHPTVIKIPFVVNGNGTIHGQFSKIEWRALIHGLSTIPRRLFSNMALVTVSQRKVLVEILQCSSNELHCRDIKALESKLEYESNCLNLVMKQLAKKYWTMKWKSEVESAATNNVDNDNSGTIIMNNKKDMVMLTDAQRSVLRGAVRPTNGECKCGSTSHTFVSDSKCPLYRDVILYCKDNSINFRGSSSSSSTTSQQYYNRGGNVKVNTNNVLEKAYVDRYIKLRNEDSAIRDEAIFVLEMEMIQSSMMQKAVLAPSSLCTLLLSAVASIQNQDELLLDAGGMNSTSNIVDMTMNRTSSKMGIQAAVPESNSDDSDDEDLPLNALVQTKQSGSKHKTMTTTNNSSPSKRPKCDTEHHAKTRSSNNLPHSYFMAKILKHISRCHGHIFTEPSHADYAWQQRHRSTITTPLSKEVMFMGNPRTPGLLSFENIHFILDDERLSRLRIAWEQQHAHNNKHDHDRDDDNNDMTEINDEWIITHLISDTVTGLRHELNVLVNMGILYIDTSGKIVLARNWEEHVPHMILNDMKYAWGTKVDVNNLFCIHDTIKTSLELYWKSNEYGWQRRRLAISNNNNVDDNNNNTNVEYENVFDDEEYQLREQIFRENYTNYLSASLGMGEFGV
jgi:hypothetical protein